METTADIHPNMLSVIWIEGNHLLCALVLKKYIHNEIDLTNLMFCLLM